MFKVGDRVRTLCDHIFFKKGQETEITSIGNNGNQEVYVTPIFNFFASELELVQPAAQAQGQHSQGTIPPGAGMTPSIAISLFGINPIQYNGWSGTVPYDIGPSQKCECGSHAVGVDRHSDYCPLYSKN